MRLKQPSVNYHYLMNRKTEGKCDYYKFEMLEKKFIEKAISNFKTLNEHLHYLGITKENRGNKVYLIDNRVVKTDDDIIVKPLFLTNRNIYFVCPICGNVRSVGISGASHEGRCITNCKTHITIDLKENKKNH